MAGPTASNNPSPGSNSPPPGSSSRYTSPCLNNNNNNPIKNNNNNHHHHGTSTSKTVSASPENSSSRSCVPSTLMLRAFLPEETRKGSLSISQVAEYYRVDASDVRDMLNDGDTFETMARKTDELMIKYSRERRPREEVLLLYMKDKLENDNRSDKTVVKEYYEILKSYTKLKETEKYIVRDPTRFEEVRTADYRMPRNELLGKRASILLIHQLLILSHEGGRPSPKYQNKNQQPPPTSNKTQEAPPKMSFPGFKAFTPFNPFKNRSQQQNTTTTTKTSENTPLVRKDTSTAHSPKPVESVKRNDTSSNSRSESPVNRNTTPSEKPTGSIERRNPEPRNTTEPPTRTSTPPPEGAGRTTRPSGFRINSLNNTSGGGKQHRSGKIPLRDMAHYYGIETDELKEELLHVPLFEELDKEVEEVLEKHGRSTRPPENVLINFMVDEEVSAPIRGFVKDYYRVLKLYTKDVRANKFLLSAPTEFTHYTSSTDSSREEDEYSFLQGPDAVIHIHRLLGIVRHNRDQHHGTKSNCGSSSNSSSRKSSGSCVASQKVASSTETHDGRLGSVEGEKNGKSEEEKGDKKNGLPPRPNVVAPGGSIVLEPSSKKQSKARSASPVKRAFTVGAAVAKKAKSASPSPKSRKRCSTGLVKMRGLSIVSPPKMVPVSKIEGRRSLSILESQAMEEHEQIRRKEAKEWRREKERNERKLKFLFESDGDDDWVDEDTKMGGTSDGEVATSYNPPTSIESASVAATTEIYGNDPNGKITCNDHESNEMQAPDVEMKDVNTPSTTGKRKDHAGSDSECDSNVGSPRKVLVTSPSKPCSTRRLGGADELTEVDKIISDINNKKVASSTSNATTADDSNVSQPFILEDDRTGEINPSQSKELERLVSQEVWKKVLKADGIACQEGEDLEKGTNVDTTHVETDGDHSMMGITMESENHAVPADTTTKNEGFVGGGGKTPQMGVEADITLAGVTASLKNHDRATCPNVITHDEEGFVCGGSAHLQKVAESVNTHVEADGDVSMTSPTAGLETHAVPSHITKGKPDEENVRAVVPIVTHCAKPLVPMRSDAGNAGVPVISPAVIPVTNSRTASPGLPRTYLERTASKPTSRSTTPASTRGSRWIKSVPKQIKIKSLAPLPSVSFTLIYGNYDSYHPSVPDATESTDSKDNGPGSIAVLFTPQLHNIKDLDSLKAYIVKKFNLDAAGLTIGRSVFVEFGCCGEQADDVVIEVSDDAQLLEAFKAFEQARGSPGGGIGGIVNSRMRGLIVRFEAVPKVSNGCGGGSPDKMEVE